MPAHNEGENHSQDPDLELEARVRSIVAKLIGEEVQEVVRATIIEQLALRFGAVPDARKARATMRAFRPDWNRRGQLTEVAGSAEQSIDDKATVAAETPEREEVVTFSPPRLVR